jgi:Zn-dependent M28 family amino/carboxypeptidase
MRSVPIGTQAIDDDSLRIPLVTVSDVIAQELLATSDATASQLQVAIDRDLKPQSRPLPDTSLNLHLRNLSRRRGTTMNVLGLLPGSDPALAPETIVISAHHDHEGGGGSEIYHGADDNASGTAGVVALAHAFARNPARPRRSILFTVFAAEERGLLGAFWLAAHPLRPLATTRAMINFDMIGRNEEASEQTNGLIEIPADTTNRLNLIGAHYSPDYARIVAEENRRVGLVLDDRFDHEHALNVFFRSDQFPFVLKNIPAFWFFTGFHPDYHHVTDTADRINYGKMAKIVQLSYLTAWRFTDDTTTPRFIESPRGQ